MSGQRQYELEKSRQRAALQRIRVGALVKVIRFDPASLTVDVALLSKWLDKGVYRSQPPILGVPAASTGGGGFLLRPWYDPGDVGVILYLDHDMDQALAGGVECEPNTERSHAQDDAVFIGGILCGGKIAGAIPPGLALARADGSVYIAVTKEGIQIAGQVAVTGTLTLNGAPVKTEG